MLLLIHLPYTYCLQWASLLPGEPTSLRPGPSVFCSEREVMLARTRWPRKHSRGSDVEIKAGRRTAPTLHSVSAHLFVPLIQACSIPVPLIASTFSKGRGIRSASIPPLCLILFCPFVVARELIKKHLITVTCCRWMVNAAAVVQLARMLRFPLPSGIQR